MGCARVMRTLYIHHKTNGTENQYTAVQIELVTELILNMFAETHAHCHYFYSI